MGEFKSYLQDFITQMSYFQISDYLVLSAIFLLVLLFFMLTIALRASAGVASLCFLLCVVILGAAPFIYEAVNENFIKPINFKLLHNSKLEYDEVFFVEGEFESRAKTLAGCVVSVRLEPSKAKPLARLRYKIKPFFEHIEKLKTPLKKGEKLPFSIIIKSPAPGEKMRIITNGSCF